MTIWVDIIRVHDDGGGDGDGDGDDGSGCPVYPSPNCRQMEDFSAKSRAANNIKLGSKMSFGVDGGGVV